MVEKILNHSAPKCQLTDCPLDSSSRRTVMGTLLFIFISPEHNIMLSPESVLNKYLSNKWMKLWITWYRFQMLYCRPLLVLACFTFYFNQWHGCAHNSMPIIFINLMKPEGKANMFNEEMGSKRLIRWARSKKMNFHMNKCLRGQDHVKVEWHAHGLCRLRKGRASPQTQTSW